MVHSIFEESEFISSIWSLIYMVIRPTAIDQILVYMVKYTTSGLFILLVGFTPPPLLGSEIHIGVF